MPEVPRQILNLYRRDMHVSDTIISADHPDARVDASTPQETMQPEAIPMMRRVLGRFTMAVAADPDMDREGRRT